MKPEEQNSSNRYEAYEALGRGGTGVTPPAAGEAAAAVTTTGRDLGLAAAEETATVVVAGWRWARQDPAPATPGREATAAVGEGILLVCQEQGELGMKYSESKGK
ncbi:hypothetical protein E2562_008617 [Oryza meyeriana var. granulata]|uniref:Uncharacterized protein n=1 Tax=Oryza meyeriana var. granulata TaxID=110450 RepID=A0A6G1C566_9ORYZ|nr:hypothetical protein E2562_008617 [Oryza meyeriana var. granulata]